MNITPDEIEGLIQKLLSCHPGEKGWFLKEIEFRQNADDSVKYQVVFYKEIEKSVHYEMMVGLGATIWQAMENTVVIK